MLASWLWLSNTVTVHTVLRDCSWFTNALVEVVMLTLTLDKMVTTM
jgi:hypothetical protein